MVDRVPDDLVVISLTDAELEAIEAAARPLPPEASGLFLEQVARAVAGRQIGPGQLHRIIAELQPLFFEPPTTKHRGRQRARNDT
jgi:hypothetical protein